MSLFPLKGLTSTRLGLIFESDRAAALRLLRFGFLTLGGSVCFEFRYSRFTFCRVFRRSVGLWSARRLWRANRHSSHFNFTGCSGVVPTINVRVPPNVNFMVAFCFSPYPLSDSIRPR